MNNALQICLFFLFSQIFAGSQTEIYSKKISQSITNDTIWTTNPTIRVFKNSPVPQNSDSVINFYCAKNETEPFVVVIKPSKAKTITISMGDFGSGIESELFLVKYVTVTTPSDNLGIKGPYPDPLIPVLKDSEVSIIANENTVFWISVYVSSTAIASEYVSSFIIDDIAIPVKLHVFDFTIPSQFHIASQMNFSYEEILSKYGVPGTGTEYWDYVEKINTFFIRHRLTPRNPLWPGALASNGCSPFIDYNCKNGTFSDNEGIWGFEQPSDKFVKGIGFNNGTGFPVFQAMTFKNNDASNDQRPSPFCSSNHTASDWYTGNNPASDYNTKWFTYIKAVQNYLKTRDLLDKTYFYFANEPQNQDDYDAVAWYSQQLKTAAPQLKLMVSEEPRPEIYNHPQFINAKIDIWLPVLHNYNPIISWDREKNNREQTWIYFLHGTRPPYFNPITLDHPGIESKLTGWFLWKYRIRGIAYYAINNWSKNPWTNL